jgi:general L-amino acid transport system permease protein
MKTERPRLWHHPQFWPWATQGLVLLCVGLLLGYFGTNLAANFQQKQLSFGFDFLQSQAGFNIGESVMAYQPTHPYLQALGVGLVNTLRIVALGLVLATLMGIGVGIARLSHNWLVRQLGTIYVETLRNTPLLLQLVFWYFAVFVSGPPFERRFHLLDEISFSQRGLLLPDFLPRLSLFTWLFCLGIGVILARWVWHFQQRRRLEQGESTKPWFMAAVTVVFWGCMAWVLTREFPFNLEWPAVQSNTIIKAGLLLTPEYSALLLGLTFYTAAFIAEIVRGGILSVPKGQWEAARSLGLNPNLTLRWVILPQALRVMVPPLTSQYLNLAKNSSLAIAVGYPDLYSVSSTTYNQTGRAIEVILLMMVTYLAISLLISLGMNFYNRRIQIVER